MDIILGDKVLKTYEEKLSLYYNKDLWFDYIKKNKIKEEVIVEKMTEDVVFLVIIKILIIVKVF